MKPRFAALLGRVIPAWAPKPLSQPALETLVIVALKQPVTLGEINAIRKIASEGTVQTLHQRKLIARAARLGPRRERYWRTTPLFLEIFQLTSLDELRTEEGRLERTFPEVFGMGMGVGMEIGTGEGGPLPRRATAGEVVAPPNGFERRSRGGRTGYRRKTGEWAASRGSPEPMNFCRAAARWASMIQAKAK